MKRFKKVYIEITNICNLTCNFCPETKRVQEHMTLERFEHVLKEVKPYTDYIYLHVKGEPLLNPKIEEFLYMGYKNGFNINITTNGTLLKKNIDKLIDKKSIRQINISLHSIEGNKSMKKNKEYMYDVLSVVKEFLRKTNIIVSLRLWNLEQDNNLNIHKNEDLLKIIEDEFSLDYKIKDILYPGRGIKLMDRLYLNQDLRFTWPSLSEKEDDGIGFCYGLRDQIGILVDGTVIPCCLDGEGILNLGNIMTTTFKDIIEGERAMNIYNGFSNRKAVEELCRKCGFRRKF